MADIAVIFMTVIAFALFAIYTYFYFQPKSTPPHPCLQFHDLVVIAQQKEPTGASGPMTIVLKRCVRCGTHVHFFLPGIWDMPTLLRTKSELAELEGMVR